MKRILIVLVASGLLASCGNKKAEIVEKIKLYQDSVNLASIEKSDIQNRIFHLMNPDLTVRDVKFDAASMKKDLAEDRKQAQNERDVLNSDQYKKMKDSIFDQGIKIDLYNAEIKSLYLELKKY